jgi:2-isopropylmalate synthase
MKFDNPYFEVCNYKVTSERVRGSAPHVQAIVELRVGGNYVRRGASGVGPVHALDNAMRACLGESFPELGAVALSDYKVSVVDAALGTAARVRVLIQATDGEDTWDAGCVSENVFDASFEALCSIAVMGIMRARARGSRRRSA